MTRDDRGCSLCTQFTNYMLVKALMDILRIIGVWFLDLVRKQGGGFVAGVGLALISAIVMSASWPYISAIFDLKFWSEGGKDVSRLDVVRNLSLIIGGGLGIGLAIWRSYTAQIVANTANQQANLVEQGQITDRFSSAIKLLTSEKLVERIGAIYTLARVAESNIETYHIPVMQILLQFIEGYPTGSDEYKRDVGQIKDSKFNTQKLNVGDDYKDLRAAIKICCNRNKNQIQFEENRNFKCKLNNLNMWNVDLGDINFYNIYIMNSVFVNCNFARSTFDRCDVSNVEFLSNNMFCLAFIDSNFIKCEFSYSYMLACFFSGTGMRNINVKFSNCCCSEMFHSYLTGSTFMSVDCTDSVVESSNISESSFTDCRFSEGICENVVSDGLRIS